LLPRRRRFNAGTALIPSLGVVQKAARASDEKASD
jgi:hypothetical protein